MIRSSWSGVIAAVSIARLRGLHHEVGGVDAVVHEVAGLDARPLADPLVVRLHLVLEPRVRNEPRGEGDPTPVMVALLVTGGA